MESKYLPCPQCGAPAARIGQGPAHDAGGAGPAGAVRLETERLVLREFGSRDWPRLYAIESDPEAVRYQSFGPRTPDECRAYIRLCARDRAARPRRVYDLAVALRPDGPVIGRCGLKLTGAEPGEATLWYMVDRARWGHGYAPEAARALLDFGFSALGVHRVWADCDPANAASIRVLEKLGMRREGHLVENAWINSAWADSLLYAILDREWRRALHPQR